MGEFTARSGHLRGKDGHDQSDKGWGDKWRYKGRNFCDPKSQLSFKVLWF